MAPSASSSILQSPLLNLNTVQKALDQSTNRTERINLLSAKIHILSNKSIPSSSNSLRQSTSSTTVSPPSATDPENHVKDRIVELERAVILLRARLELSQALMSVVPVRKVEAEAELTTVEGECKRWSKRWTKRQRASRTVAWPSITTGAEDREAEETASGHTKGSHLDTTDNEGVDREGVPEPLEVEEAAETEGSEIGDEELRLRRAIVSLRIKALAELVTVEEALGRDGRARRWTDLIRDLEAAPR